MKFIVETHYFRRMLAAVGKKYPGTPRRDAEITLNVLPGLVIATTTCRAGGVLALGTESGQCTLPRLQFENVLATFKDEEVLSVKVNERGLTIKNFKMPVLKFSPIPQPPTKYDWFGDKPPI
jgi:hypothetical protein